MRTLLLILPLLLVCSCGNETGDVATLNVFAAASTTDVVNDLALGYGDARVKSSFGASGDLARQIKDGAPADVYISASRKWVDYLTENNALEGDPVVFARNALVCVAPLDSKLTAEDAAALIAKLSGNDKVAIADEGVPAGDYARQSLVATKDLPALQPWLVGQKDVRAVLRAVESAECAAGFVYATDAKVADVRVLFTLQPDTHKPIEYFVASVKGGNTALAENFIAYLKQEAARDALSKAGFVLP